MHFFEVTVKVFRHCSIIINNFKNYKLKTGRAFSVKQTLRFSTLTGITKMEKTHPKIGTHDGIFHCDEILACFMLQKLVKYKNAEIIRSRNDDILEECDIVVDVGGIFDQQTLRFDHHQKSFQHTLSTLRPEMGDNWTIRLSSAGLIYVFYGEEIIASVVKELLDIDMPEDQLKQIYKKIYEYFIQEIDAIDNGVPMCDGEPLYKINTHLSARVAHYNEEWNAPKGSFDASSQFEKAKKLVGEEFINKILYYTKVWWPARSVVDEAIRNRFTVHSSGEIIELSVSCPWKIHLFELEKEQNIEGVIKYVLFQNSPTDFRVMCVPNAPTSFICRKFLHKDWRGLRKDEIIQISGIQDAHFCHSTGFIGGATSRNGSYAMAVTSLEAHFDD